jgi:hypothetical protein
MSEILIALSIGIVAGIIDIIPMLILKTDKMANLSAFTHWVVLGLLIPFISWDIPAWLKGLIIGELSAVPVILMIFKEDKKAVFPILIMSALLGAGIGMASAAFIHLE